MPILFQHHAMISIPISISVYHSLGQKWQALWLIAFHDDSYYQIYKGLKIS